MNFSVKIRYDNIFQKVTHKVGESEINYTKRLQNSQDLLVSVGNNYSEDQFMHILLDNFHQCGKYSASIASHQAGLIREGIFTVKTPLSISSLCTYYLNLDISSGYGRNNERANLVQKKCTFCGGNNHSAEKFFTEYLYP